MQGRFVVIPEVLLGRGMTAILQAFTTRGFVVAADGRSCGPDNATVVSDSTQKVFPVESANGPLALSTCGAGEIEFPDGTSINLAAEFVRSASLLRKEKFADLRTYAARLCKPVIEILMMRGNSRFDSEKSEENATDSEPGTTVGRIFLDGYFKNRPGSVTIRLFRESDRLQEPEIREPPLSPGYLFVWGSDVVARLLFQDEDPRFSRYVVRRVHPHNMTVQDVVERACAYIEACSDPLAIDLDSFCSTIGGHIHIATITREEGFQWIPGFSPLVLH